MEGIKWTPIEYFNNKIVCEMIECKVGQGATFLVAHVFIICCMRTCIQYNIPIRISHFPYIYNLNIIKYVSLRCDGYTSLASKVP